MKIFIFDRDASRPQLEQALRPLGAELHGSDDLELAIQLCYEQEFDLILVGISSAFHGLPLIERLHGIGSRTPAIVVAGDAKRTQLAQAIKLGPAEILMIPVEARTLQAAVAKATAARTAAAPSPAPAAHAPEAAAVGQPAAAVRAAPRVHRDILMVIVEQLDVDELRPLLSSEYSIDSCMTPTAALQACAEAEYRVVLIGATFSNLHRVDMLAELRAVQPRASFLALYQRSKADRHEEARNLGFASHLLRPYEQASINELRFKWLGWKALLQRTATEFRPEAFPYDSPYLNEYYDALMVLIEQGLDELAAACESEIILEISQLPMHSIRTPEFVVHAQATAKVRGIEMTVTGARDVLFMAHGPVTPPAT